MAVESIMRAQQMDDVLDIQVSGRGSGGRLNLVDFPEISGDPYSAVIGVGP